MDRNRYEALVKELCKELDVVDVEGVLQRGAMTVAGHEVQVSHFSNDKVAMYLNFSFGIVGAGKTQNAFHQLLVSNMSIYAQDQGQLGVVPATGGILLIVRVPMTDEVDGKWLADTFVHYAEHGKYWRDTLHAVVDEQFAGPPETHFLWMRA
jgi:hypothetical protein